MSGHVGGKRESIDSRPVLAECFPRYADRGDGVCGIPVEEFSEENAGGVGPGIEYCRVREGVDTGDETYGEKVRCGCGVVCFIVRHVHPRVLCRTLH